MPRSLIRPDVAGQILHGIFVLLQPALSSTLVRKSFGWLLVPWVMAHALASGVELHFFFVHSDSLLHYVVVSTMVCTLETQRDAINNSIHTAVCAT